MNKSGTGNFDQGLSEEARKVMELKEHKFETMARYLHDASLDNEPMFTKMRDRVTAFFRQLEKNGEATAHPAGVPLSFVVQLHTSLRQLLLHVVLIKDQKVKLI